MGSTYFISELDTYSTFLMLARARSALLSICLHTYPAQRHGQSQSHEVGRIRMTSTLPVTYWLEYTMINIRYTTINTADCEKYTRHNGKSNRH